MTASSAALRPMGLSDLDAVVAIEVGAYGHPWTRGNFVDSLVAGHDAQVLVDAEGAILGYTVCCDGVDEWHLLNITVARERQRHGLGRRLLGAVIEQARRRGRASVWLEVRSGNVAARALYERLGFVTTGVRPRYYPGRDGREDAVLMSLPITEETR